MKLILADTVGLMNSGDYRDRFVAEYIQLKIRYERLKDFNTRIEAAVRTRGADIGVDEPEHDCPAGLLREQQAAMGEYLHLLEIRAKIEDIDLGDMIDYFSDRKCKCEKSKIVESISENPIVLADTVPPEIQKIHDELIEERRLEHGVCVGCVHYPICNYLVDHLQKFKLPRNAQGCDLFMDANGEDEPCECEKDESDVMLK